MVFSSAMRAMRERFDAVFHTRRIIIISDHKTKHISLSSGLQVGALLGAAACIVWASYSTGSYFSARSVMEAQDETIRSVANSRVDMNFGYFGATLSAESLKPAAFAASQFTDPGYALAGLDSDKLFARIAYLEGQVEQLQEANVTIIETVRKKTNDKIADLESVIRNTGLDPSTLKKQAEKQQRKEDKIAENFPSQGGPFIPADPADLRSLDMELNNNIEQLTLLSDIVGTLPLASPIRNASLQSQFGTRVDPFSGRLAFHSGVDLAGPAGSPVLAANDGVVETAQRSGAYGNVIDIDHGFGIVTRYGHLSRIDVQKGQRVKRGQTIGAQGSTGRSTGAHLHYEVRFNNRPLNPNNFLRVGLNVSQNQH